MLLSVLFIVGLYLFRINHIKPTNRAGAKKEHNKLQSVTETSTCSGLTWSYAYAMPAIYREIVKSKQGGPSWLADQPTKL